MTRSLILASASPARLRLLVDAGFAPTVVVSGVDEDTFDTSDPWRLVEQLAIAKATGVAESCAEDAVVIGCDSMLLLDGRTFGKPGTAEAARERWQRMRGRHGALLTGHCVIDTGTGRQESAVADTVVRFGNPTDEEVAAYIATGEPLAVAGAFTIDGRAAPFIEGIDGDPSTVIGLSLPTFRELLLRLGVSIMELWR